jgi:acylphosphatase
MHRFYSFKMQRVHLIIKGHVQGVFFRGSIRQLATRLELNGFVTNLSNGNVEVIAEGSKEVLEELIAFCKKGPEGAEVEEIEIKYEKVKKDFNEFYVR